MLKEWRQLSGFRGLYVFVSCCLLLHLVTIFRPDYSVSPGYFRCISDTVRTTEITKMGEAWDEAVTNNFPESNEKITLIRDTAGKEDILEGYRGMHIVQLMEENWQLGGIAARWQRAKYEKLQPSIDTLAEEDASLSVFASTSTPRLMTKAQDLLKLLMLEGMILACLTACFLTGNDRLCRTEGIICASEAGRDLWKVRSAVGILHLFCIMFLLYAVTAAAFLLRWDMSGMWEASVSTQFLGFLIGAENVPFITWAPMTVTGYFAAASALGMLMVLFIYCLCYGAGLAVHNSYALFLFFAALFITNIALLTSTEDNCQWLGYELLQWLPFSAWHVNTLWFSHMLGASILPWQETLEVLWLGIWSGCLLSVCFRIWKRRDL